MPVILYNMSLVVSLKKARPNEVEGPDLGSCKFPLSSRVLGLMPSADIIPTASVSWNTDLIGHYGSQLAYNSQC